MKWYMLWVASPAYQTIAYPDIPGVVFWIPSKPRVFNSGDDCCRIYEPLYEGYIFVGFKDDSNIAAVEKQIRQGVSGVSVRKHRSKGMRQGSLPASKVTEPSMFFLRDGAGSYKRMSVSEVQDAVTAAKSHEHSDYARNLKPGNTVILASGPFCGAKGKVLRIDLNAIVADVNFNGRKLVITVAPENFAILETK